MPANPALIRQAINRRVNEYCGYHNVLQHDTWTFVYKQLRYECGIDLYRIRRTGRESLLDVAERSGHLPRLYELVIKELGLPEE